MTEKERLAWPCELREFWNSISPLKQLVQGLFSYGTVFIIVIGLVLNTISFRILLSPCLRRSSPNLYLLALSVYDCGVLLFNFMIGVLRKQNPDTINAVFQENEWLCILHSVAVELFNLLSIWMIVCLTIERLIVVSLPMKAAQYCSVKRTKIIITIVSGVSLAISCHKILAPGFEGDSVFGYKACLTHRMKLAHIMFFYVSFNTWLPTFTILVVNLLITSKIRQAGHIRRTLSPSSNRWQKSMSTRSIVLKSEMKLTKMMKAISLTYLLLVLPLGIVQCAELYWNNFQKTEPSPDFDEQRNYIYYKEGKIVLKDIRAMAFFFYQMNFSVNFFVYYVQNPKFRASLWEFLPCLPVLRSMKKKTQRQYNLHHSQSNNTASTAVGSKKQIKMSQAAETPTKQLSFISSAL